MHISVYNRFHDAMNWRNDTRQFGAGRQWLRLGVSLAFMAIPWFRAFADDRLPAPASSGSGASAPTVHSSAHNIGDEKSSSSAMSNQFDVHAESLSDRAALATFAKSVNEDFDRLFGMSSDWTVPIRLQLFKGLGTEVGIQDSRTEVEYFDDAREFTIVLHLKLPEGFSNRWLEREIVRVLLLEQMLSGNRPEETANGTFGVPFWLSTGVLEAISHRSRGRPSDIYSRLVRSRQVLPIEQLLGSSEQEVGDDALSESVFRASAAALVEALLEQENGKMNLRNWLADLPLKRGDMTALFRQHFPSLRSSEASLSKWWALQVASMGQLQALEYYDVDETEKALDAALQIQLPALTRGTDADAVRDGDAGMVKRVLGWFSDDDEAVFTAGHLQDFERFVDHPKAPLVLENCRQALEGVRVRCFPLYRPIIDQYQAAVERLMKGDTAGVEELLAEGDDLRGQIRSVMTRAKDFMNYYEATQVGQRSGDFKGYHELLDQMRSQKPKSRGDRISTHLDELEREFE